MNLKLTKVFQKVPEGFVGFVEELPAIDLAKEGPHAETIALLKAAGAVE